MLTVDANVFVSAYQRKEVQHTDSDLFLKRAVQQAREFHCPALLLPESAAAIIRPTGNLVLARLAVTQMQQFPGMLLATLTEIRAAQAAQLTILYRLRGPMPSMSPSRRSSGRR